RRLGRISGRRARRHGGDCDGGGRDRSLQRRDAAAPSPARARRGRGSLRARAGSPGDRLRANDPPGDGLRTPALPQHGIQDRAKRPGVCFGLSYSTGNRTVLLSWPATRTRISFEAPPARLSPILNRTAATPTLPAATPA